MFAAWNSGPSTPSLFSHPSDSHGPWRVGFGRSDLEWWVMQRPHGGQLGVVLPGWPGPDPDLDPGFAEGAWAVASCLGRQPCIRRRRRLQSVPIT